MFNSVCSNKPNSNLRSIDAIYEKDVDIKNKLTTHK